MRIILLFLFFQLTTIIFYGQNVNLLMNSSLSEIEKIDTLYSIAKNYYKKLKLDSCYKTIEIGMPLALKSNINNSIVNFYVLKSAVLRIQKKTASALEEINKADRYVNNSSLPKTSYHYQFNKLLVLVDANYTDSAFYYYTQLEELCNKNFPYDMWGVNIGIARLFLKQKNDTKVEEYLLKSFAIVKTGNIKADKFSVIIPILNFYKEKNNTIVFAKYLEEFQTFKESIAKKISDNPAHALLYIDWTGMNFNERLKFLQNVKQHLTKNKYNYGLVECNNDISKLLANNNFIDSALIILKENITIIPDRELVNHYYNYKNICDLQKKYGKLTEAISTAETIIEIANKISSQQSVSLSLEIEQKYQAEKKNRDIELLSTKNKLAQNEIELLNFETENNSKTIALLQADKKIKEVEFFQQTLIQKTLEQQNNLQDSLYEKEQYANLLLANENNLKTEQLNKEQIIKEALSRESNLKTNKLVQERQTKWLLTGGIALLLISGFSIFKLYKKQKNKNSIIQKQAANLEILMKEIHHRVKNNMQIVSSLLDLQSISIKDQQASDAVKEGKNRVQSMALIHQNLYSEDNLKGIKAKLYINNLLQNLCDSYSISSDKVKIYSNIQDLNLDVDTMIPIGLIFNELLTNAFKYAFNDNTNGVLEIALKEENNQLQLSVKDNGPGFPMELDAKTTKSFGLRMIRAFAQKLKAEVEIKNDDGAFVQLYIKKYLIA
jgi:two-component sensor histidine kinase